MMMTTELTMLAWTLVLALVQIILAAHLRTRETGLSYAAGPRDVSSPAPIGIVTGRVMRAQKNLFETLPLFADDVLIAHAAQIHSALTYWGVMLYFWARLIYVPVYASGLAYVRTLIWAASLAGLVLLLVAVL